MSRPPPCPQFSPSLTCAMTTLWTIHADILAEITDRLTNHQDICALWMCGSARLNQRLGAGGVRTFTVDSSTGNTNAWLPIASSLSQLHTFELLARRDTQRIDTTLTTLPLTVKHIKLKFLEDANTLCQALIAYPHRFTNLLTVRLSHIPTRPLTELVRALPRSVHKFVIGDDDDLSGNYIHQLVNVCDLPPNLATIKININHQLTAPKGYDRDQTSLLLPNLTCYYTTASSNTWMALLPKHLMRLELDEMLEVHLPLLPPALTRLYISTLKCATSTLLGALPQTLTRLSLPELKEADMGLLPRQLTMLECNKIGAITRAAALALPRSLTKLRNRMAGSTCVSVYDNALAHIPPGICRLRIKAHADNPHFRSASITLTQPISVACKKLELPELNASTRGRLPPQLKSLYVSSLAIRDGTLDCIADLPVSLTSLIIQSFELESSFLSSLFARLPRLLRVCVIRADNSSRVHYIADSSSFELPRTLTHLTFEVVHIKVDSTWFAGLPTGLETLALALPTFTAEDAMAMPFTHISSLILSLKVWDVRILPALPRTLIELEIIANSDDTVHGHSHAEMCALLSGLPPKLVNCHLPRTTPFDKHMRPHIPNTLTELFIDYGAVSWEDE